MNYLDEKYVKKALIFLSPNDPEKSREEFNRTRLTLSARFGRLASIGDTVWGMLNNRVLAINIDTIGQYSKLEKLMESWKAAEKSEKLRQKTEQLHQVKYLETHPACPTCQHTLDKKPKRQKKCPNCNQIICVRYGLLLTKDQKEVEEALDCLSYDPESYRDAFKKIRQELSLATSLQASVTDTLLNMLTHIATETPSIIVELHCYMRMVRWLQKINEDYGEASSRLWDLLGEYAEQTKDVQELYYIYKHMRDLAKIDGIDPAPYEELRQGTIKILQNAN
tara:strand:- start:177 stop:1016 length:840 start_codon:yes stop_codon:yes gene_type:complete